jgi:hypothetical protein
MHSGYLTVETNPAYPGTIRLRGVDALPTDRPASLKYASRFTDLDAALMHFHSALRRHLVDLERRIYSTSVSTAIAVAEAIELPHRRAFIDPDLADDHDLNKEIDRLHRSHRRRDRLFNLVGVLALLLLLATAFL